MLSREQKWGFPGGKVVKNPPANAEDRKDSDAGRDWGQEEKGTTEDEMAGCYH